MAHKFRILFLIVLSVASAAHADEASKRAKIKEYFQLTGMQARMDQARAAATAQSSRIMKQMVGDMNPSPSQDRIITTYYTRVNRLIADTYDWEKVEPAYVDAFAKVYTEGEMDGVIAFYKSPIGQSFMAKRGDALTSIENITSKLFDSLQPQIQQLTQEMMSAITSDSAPIR